MVPFDRLCMISYYCSIEILSLRCPIFEIFDFRYARHMTDGQTDRQPRCHSKDRTMLCVARVKIISDDSDAS